MRGRKFISLEKLHNADASRFKFDEVLMVVRIIYFRKNG